LQESSTGRPLNEKVCIDTQAFEHGLAQASQLSRAQRSTTLRVLHKPAVMAVGQERLPD